MKRKTRHAGKVRYFVMERQPDSDSIGMDYTVKDFRFVRIALWYAKWLNYVRKTNIYYVVQYMRG